MIKAEFNVNDFPEFKTYLESKGLSSNTVVTYVRYVNRFVKHSPKEMEQVTKADILTYLEHLKSSKNQENITRRNHLIAISHYFAFLIQNDHVVVSPTAFIKIRGKHKKHLYQTYTFEELQQLYDNYYHTFIRNYDNTHMPKNQRNRNELFRQRNYAMLGFLVYQGLHTNELERITLKDLNLMKAQVLVRGSKKSNERILPLNAAQIGALMNYLQNIRSIFLTFCGESEQLFLPLPEVSKTTTHRENLIHTFKPMAKQVKSICTRFSKFEQVRASVITHWIKTEGLRKAQYFAGHRYVSSTEKYQSNDLESLSEDISKYNSF